MTLDQFTAARLSASQARAVIKDEVNALTPIPDAEINRLTAEISELQRQVNVWEAERVAILALHDSLK